MRRRAEEFLTDNLTRSCPAPRTSTARSPTLIASRTETVSDAAASAEGVGSSGSARTGESAPKSELVKRAAADQARTRPRCCRQIIALDLSGRGRIGTSEKASRQARNSTWTRGRRAAGRVSRERWTPGRPPLFEGITSYSSAISPPLHRSNCRNARFSPHFPNLAKIFSSRPFGFSATLSSPDGQGVITRTGNSAILLISRRI